MALHSQIGVLIAQLGTPDAPTAQALRPYLKQFLSDRRVIDYSPLIWQICPFQRHNLLPRVINCWAVTITEE